MIINSYHPSLLHAQKLHFISNNGSVRVAYGLTSLPYSGKLGRLKPDSPQRLSERGTWDHRWGTGPPSWIGTSVSHYAYHFPWSVSSWSVGCSAADASGGLAYSLGAVSSTADRVYRARRLHSSSGLMLHHHRQLTECLICHHGA